MEITYLGHSAFKIKGKSATIVTDPYDKGVGFTMPKVSADIVTLSHKHEDHSAANKVSGTARRDEPYVIEAPGEYEVNGIGVFGWGSFHDDKKGEERGKNTIYTYMVDGIRLGHLGDLGHEIDDDLDNSGMLTDENNMSEVTCEKLVVEEEYIQDDSIENEQSSFDQQQLLNTKEDDKNES